MFAYCLNNPQTNIDREGTLALPFFLDTIMGDGEDREYNKRSKIAKELKKSKELLDEFYNNVEYFVNSEAIGSGLFFGDFSTYDDDYDLSLTVGRARYMMTITKETRTKGILWWKEEQSRYVAQVLVWDSYDFTEWFSGSSFGAIANNIAYVGQMVGVIIPYDWSVSFTIETEWE